jgi:NAD(P)-dependent dehydrogenase (short-subunit alcohol dehydrogenase family)
MQLAGKSVLITGGGGGIGEGMAQAFAERGSQIVIADISMDYAKAAAAGLPAGAEAMVVELDVTSLESWAAMRQRVAARFGLIDVLCNNAGISSGFKPLVEIQPDEFNRLMAINVTGVYNGIFTFAREMSARGSGHIVNTSSMNGLSPYGSLAAYSASKFAVLGLSDALRQELAPVGVGVSTLFPGPTRSRMSDSAVLDSEKSSAQRAASIQANRMEPIWLGRAVVRAVEVNEPYIVSHPEYKNHLAARFDEILGAFREPAQPGYSSARK